MLNAGSCWIDSVIIISDVSPVMASLDQTDCWVNWEFGLLTLWEAWPYQSHCWMRGEMSSGESITSTCLLSAFLP